MMTDDERGRIALEAGREYDRDCERFTCCDRRRCLCDEEEHNEHVAAGDDYSSSCFICRRGAEKRWAEMALCCPECWQKALLEQEEG